MGAGIKDLWDTYITQPAERNANKVPTSINKSSLITAVSIGKLTDASSSYEGVAVKTNDKGEEICHIYYETSVLASVETSDIDFVVDEEQKTVTPSLPEQQIDVDIPSSGSIVYFEDNPDISLGEALELCKEDAQNEASGNQALITCGQENLRKTVEALLDPILAGTDYIITW